jgi:hypothetical protein
MEETRASIRNTVEELRGRVSDTFDWRQYVNRYPGASLTLAVGVGMVLGRGVAALVVRRDRGAEAEYAYRTAETYGESGFTTTRGRSEYGSEEPTLSGARRAMGQSVSRLGSRAEGVLNRLIDELTDAVETTLVPALTGRFRSLIDMDRRSLRRRESGSGGEVAGSGPARWEEPSVGERGVYGGGPTGQQHYPTQHRSAEQA